MSYENEWDDTPERESSTFEDRVMDDVPDGTYTADVSDFSIFTGKGGDWFVSWWFRVTGGQFDGCEVQRFNKVAGGMSYIKADLRVALGEVPRWPDLVVESEGRTRAEIRQRIVGASVTIRQRTRHKGDDVYVDIFLNRLLEAPPVTATADDDDDTPPQPRDQDHADRAAAAEPAKLPDAPTEAQDGDTAATPAGGEKSANGEGWGDPACEDCKGSGCASCAPF